MEYNLKAVFEASSGLKSLAAVFAELTDLRKRRGIRYELAMLLILMVLAKLCGADTPSEIAGWINERPALVSKNDFPTVTTLDKAHGRIEQRKITVSTKLNDYLEWPYLGQVFEIKRETEILSKNEKRNETVYGVTSLGPEKASAKRLLALNRGHWGIENGSHHRRDVTFKEDACRMKSLKAAEAIAIFNNLSIGIIKHLGWINAAEARRHFCAHVDKALLVILNSPQRL